MCGASDVEKLQFLTPAETVAVREEFGTPTYVYDLARIKAGLASAFSKRCIVSRQVDNFEYQMEPVSVLALSHLTTASVCAVYNLELRHAIADI